jgi:hypothetical protein
MKLTTWMNLKSWMYVHVRLRIDPYSLYKSMLTYLCASKDYIVLSPQSRILVLWKYLVIFFAIFY